MPNQANDTEQISHDNSSAGYTERPKGAGTDGSMRSTIAWSGPICCGGPGKKYGRMEGARASMVLVARMSSAKAWTASFKPLRTT